LLNFFCPKSMFEQIPQPEAVAAQSTPSLGEATLRPAMAVSTERYEDSR